MKLDPVTPDTFRLRANGASARLRTVKKPRFTEWGEISVPVRAGAAVLPDDAILMAMIHRHGRAPAVPVLGVLQGWSTWRGAIATTVEHDSHNLAVFGRDPADMAAAANAVIAARGGMAVAAGGVVRALLKLPICGLISDAPAEETAAAFERLKQAADAVVDWQPPILTFKAIVGASLACNPGPHVTDRGITDGTTGEVFASALIAAQ
jgi:adenine deaminase